MFMLRLNLFIFHFFSSIFHGVWVREKNGQQHTRSWVVPFAYSCECPMIIKRRESLFNFGVGLMIDEWMKGPSIISPPSFDPSVFFYFIISHAMQQSIGIKLPSSRTFDAHKFKSFSFTFMIFTCAIEKKLFLRLLLCYLRVLESQPYAIFLWLYNCRYCATGRCHV